jgi:hypothetical protein
MLNPGANANDAYEFLGGNISDFYADVDDAITLSECVKGQYRLNVQPAVNANENIVTPNFATVNLSAPGSLVVDLENSYISLDAAVTISSNRKHVKTDTNPSQVTYFVGWKSSFEAIKQYEILVNGNVVYTQSFAFQESFIQDQIVTELVRNTSQFIYSSWENVCNIDPCVCGTYVTIDTRYDLNANSKIECVIPLKIPIDRFLI